MRKRNSSTRAPSLPAPRIAASLAGSACAVATASAAATSKRRDPRVDVHRRLVPAATAAPRRLAVRTRSPFARGVELANCALLERIILGRHGGVDQVLP